jgi:2,3-dihydroxy-p-cumate/2,3-dihydroxybenzoate 3,4-dioxygenase
MPRYSKLGYVALNVTDVARARDFYEGMVGLKFAGEGEAGEVFFRCSTNHHDVILYPAKKPGLKRFAFEMASEQELDAMARSLSAEGLRVVELERDERRALHQGRTIRVTEPYSGATLEFYSEMSEFGGQPFVPTLAKIQRLGHVVLKVAEFERACDFYQRVLGLAVSDQIDGLVCFMRCNAYHHGIGIAKAVAPLLHHVNFMVSEVDDIGKAIARFAKKDVPIVNGPGRHPPSGSMFLYFLDPDGMTVEYSFGMEEFPEEKARKPRTLEAIPESFDYWGSFLDRQRKSAIGEIERLDRSNSF